MRTSKLLNNTLVFILGAMFSFLGMYCWQPCHTANRLSGPHKRLVDITGNHTQEHMRHLERKPNDNIPTTSVQSNPIVRFINQQMKKAETLKSRPVKHETKLKAYYMFNRKNIFRSDMSMEHPKEPLYKHRDLSKELASVISYGIASLNNGSTKMKVYPSYQFTEADFLHGLLRIEMGVGIHYELVYKSHVNKPKLFRSTLFRPFAPVYSIKSSFSDATEMIYVVVPLYGRLSRFKTFIENFKKVAVPDKNVHLTVVYYGSRGVTAVEKTLELLRSSNNFGNYKLVKILNEPFARGRARDHGVKSIDNIDKKSPFDPLIFFCDVDMAFTSGFLNQCRSHTTAGKSVFFPIIFSLYNPKVVYGNEQIPPLRKQQQHSGKSGFWRNFGYGMSCQYRSDYKRIGGFDLSINGWGSEDVLLARKYAGSKISVIRTPVDSIFHHWHEKVCDKSLPADQYLSCLGTRALTEGSSLDLGLKYFQLKEKFTSLRKK